MAKSETIVEIAEEAGVSATTVSMVLNGKADKYRISQATQERVRQVVSRSEFKPNQQARSLRTNKTFTIGLVVPDLSTHYFSHMAKDVERCARRLGYQVFIVDSDNSKDNEIQLIDELRLRGVDGLIVASTQEKWLLNYDGPLVFLDRALLSEQSVVSTNNVQATFELVSQLIERNIIDKHAQYIGGDLNISTARDRWTGFEQALKAHDIDPRSIQRHDGVFEKAWGKTAMQRIHDNGFESGAIFMGAQMLSEGVLSWWQEQGRSVPDSIRLCAFDDHPFFNYLPFPIASIEQDVTAMAESVVHLILNHIENPKMKHEQCIVPARLHIRF